MCQLSLVSTNNETTNKVIIYSLLAENSKALNQDGTGIFTPKMGILKTKLPACDINNLGQLLRERRTSTLPMLGHVRNASVKYGDRMVDDDHAHPFDSDHYVLAHNGSLEFKDPKREEEYKDKKLIDSQIFLIELEKNYTGDVYADLVKTMQEFVGKFAFIIYHKAEKKFYIVRGRTATLYLCPVKIDENQGIVINTEEKTMDLALLRSCNMLQLSGRVFNYNTEVSKIAPIPIESVYELQEDNDIRFIGKIEQNERPVVASQNFTQGRVWDATKREYVVTPAKTTGSTTERPDAYFQWFIKETSLSIGDLDELAFRCIKRPLISFTTDDVVSFVLIIEELMKSFTTLYKECWGRLRHHAEPAKLYIDYPSLQFPYWLTDMTTLTSIYADLKLKEQEAKNATTDIILGQSVLDGDFAEG